MAFHLSAFVQSIDQANALTAITAAREEMIFTNGVDLRIPQWATKVAMLMAAVNDASIVRAQLQSPSLRVQTNIDIEPMIQGANFGAAIDIGQFTFDTPLELVTDEAINFFVQADPAAPVINAGLVMLCDGPLTPITGKVFTVRATAAIQQVVANWVNGTITLGQVLPAGEYAVVGARFRSADAIAMRLVFSAQVTRPGLPSGVAVGTREHPRYRAGGLGVWGTFPNTIPPTLDVIGGVGTAQTILLDLVRVS